MQDIKEIPIFNKIFKDSYIKKPRRKKKDPPTINVVGTLVDLMLGKHSNPKYSNPSSPIVYVNINMILMLKTFIDLGETINVMTKNNILKLNLQPSLRHNTTILQLADSSNIFPLGILEDIIVYLNS